MLSGNQSNVSEKEISQKIEILKQKLSSIKALNFDEETEKELFDLNIKIEEIKEKIDQQVNKLSTKNREKLANKQKLSKLERFKNFKILKKLKSLQNEIEILKEELNKKLFPLYQETQRKIQEFEFELQEIQDLKPENIKKREENARNPEKIQSTVKDFSMMIASGDFSKLKENSEKIKKALPYFESLLQNEIIGLLKKQIELNKKHLETDRCDLEIAESDLQYCGNNAQLKLANEKLVKNCKNKIESRENFSEIAEEIISSIVVHSEKEKEKEKEEALSENIEDIESTNEVILFLRSDDETDEVISFSENMASSSSSSSRTERQLQASEKILHEENKNNKVAELTSFFEAKSQKKDEQKKAEAKNLDQKKYNPVRLTVR